MKIGVPVEQFPGERRVALVPASIAPLKKAGFDVTIERGAGDRAGFPDNAYTDKGAQIAASRADVFAADVVLQVRAGDIALMRPGQIVIAMADPLGAPGTARDLASSGVTAFALELIPRITRAQSMDVLSSMATVAGYKAVLLAAETLPRMFPLLTTAAGTITPAHVFIVGVGVAGLRAHATARKVGAIVVA
jgi:NAD(P) transhydrogenase subunit alpha